MTTSVELLVIILLSLIALSLRDGLGILLILVDSPVEDVIVLKAFSHKEVAEDLAKVGVVGLIIEAEGAGVVKIDGKLIREAATEHFGGRGHLLLHDPVVLLLLGGGLETLPGQRATAEVEHDIAERLHVITTGLFCISCIST